MPPVTTDAQDVFGGPAYVTIGNPTVAAGASMVDLGLLPRVSVQLTFYRQSLQNELQQKLADGAWGALQGGTCRLTMMNKSATLLAALFPEFTAGAASIGVSESITALALPTIAIMPVEGFGTGPTYAQLQWAVASLAMDIGEFIRKVERSAEATETFEVTFELTRAVFDRAATPQAINANYQIWFEGSAEDALGATPALPWTLPTGY